MPLYNLMEDLATAEISRSQLYQWIKHGVRTEEGELITKESVVAGAPRLCLCCCAALRKCCILWFYCASKLLNIVQRLTRR